MEGKKERKCCYFKVMGSNNSRFRVVAQELTDLLCNAISVCVNDVSLFSCEETVNSKRLQSFIDAIHKVQNASTSWRDLTMACVNSGEPAHITIDKILCCYPKGTNNYRLMHIMCLCVYTVDVCVIKLLRKEEIDVKLMIDTLITYMVKRNIVMCDRLLAYLDV